jgi:hypothetical protein
MGCTFTGYCTVDYPINKKFNETLKKCERLSYFFLMCDDKINDFFLAG